MGWPKKNEGYRLYYEPGPKSYILIDRQQGYTHDGCHWGLSEVLINNDPNKPQVSSSAISPMHIYKKCRRTSWDQLPQVWKDAFKGYLEGDPKDFRGLWRVEKKGTAL